MTRSRFNHWEKRLSDHLQEPELSFSKAILGYLAKADDGLSTRQLLSRLSRREPDPDKREALLQSLLIKLAEEGYLSQPDAQGRIRYLSFLLRDWWKRNHA